MSFFELPEIEPPRPWRPMPPWRRAPEHELGVDLPFRTTIASDDDLWLGLIGVSAYSIGFALRILFLRRPHDLIEVFQDDMSVRISDGRVTEKFLRLGVEFADGRRATNLDDLASHAKSESAGAPKIAFAAHGRGRGPSSGAIGVWIWPLPPPGPLALVVEWPSVGVAQTPIELPGDRIRAAAATSKPLWDDDRQWRDSEDD